MDKLGLVQTHNPVEILSVASQLGVVLPSEIAVSLLRDPAPSVRAAACGCVRAGHELIAELVSMMGDPEIEVAIASACALGHIGHAEARRPLKRYLAERPSLRIVEALSRVAADDEALVLLSRTGRARHELIKPAISALEEIESPRALNAANALKRFSRRTE